MRWGPTGSARVVPIVAGVGALVLMAMDQWLAGLTLAPFAVLTWVFGASRPSFGPTELERAAWLAGVGAWRFDLRTRRFGLSELARAVHELPATFDATYESIRAFYPAESLSALDAAVERTVRERVGGELELMVRTVTGRQRWVRLVWEPELRAGRVMALSGSAQDVTSRKEAEVEAVLLARHLEQQTTIATQMARDARAASAAKSDFLATMSHEIRTPLNGIIGFTRLLDESALSPEQRDFTAVIRSSGDALLHLVNDILDFSKVEAGRVVLEAAPFSPREIADEVVRLLTPRALERRVGLSAVIDEGVPTWVRGDASRWRQVLMNLVGNALKFTERGGVEVRLRDGARLRVEVADSGIGISPEDQLRLFEKFTQVDSSTTRRFGGTGLGLSISRRLVELMGGAIGVESAPGQGSTFWFEVPLPRAEAPVHRATPLPAEGVAQAGLSVLMAEDNIVNQRLLQALLVKRGCVVTVVSTGAQAVDATRQQVFDVVFMDCHMPELDGFAATRQIRELERALGRRRVPIIAVTASAMREDIEACTASGMDDFMSKPVDVDALVERLARVQASRERVQAA